MQATNTGLKTGYKCYLILSLQEGYGHHDRSFKGDVVSRPDIPCGCREGFGITWVSGGQLPRKRQSDNDRGVCPLLVPSGMWG